MSIIKSVASTSGVAQTKERPVAKVVLADVERFGDKLILPAKMKIEDAITLLERQLKYEQEEINMSRTIACFPWDGAIALSSAMQEQFGWVTAEPTPGFFGPEPPQIIQVEVGYNRKQGVAWGAFSLPGIEGKVSTGAQFVGNPPTLHFSMSAKVRRLDADAITTLFDRTETLVSERSI